jgi:anti-sigma B factor antagonist
VTSTSTRNIASQLSIDVRYTARRADLRLIGELDSATTDTLAAAVSRASRTGGCDVHCDLSELTFCDAAGLGALIQLRQCLAGSGQRFWVSGARGIPLKVLRLTDTQDFLANGRNT